MKVENESDVYRDNGAEPTRRRAAQGEQPPLPLVDSSAGRGYVAVLLVVFGILPRIQARTALRQETARMAVPTVAVVQPKRSAPAQEIVLPANVQAFADAPIYARTNGYLKRWYVDIGSRVKAGPTAG